MAKAGEIQIRIRARDPSGPNHNGDSPNVERIDLIVGDVTGPSEDPILDTNPSTTVVTASLRC